MAALAACVPLLLLPAPAVAAREDLDRLSAYARARAASGLGAPGDAARGYAAALALSPGNDVLAQRTVSEAVLAGDRTLALQTLPSLDQATLRPDARLLRLSASVAARDWAAATREAEAIGADDIFSFMTPILMAWIAQESGRGDPIAILNGGAQNPLAAAYAVEHRPLLEILRGQADTGVPKLLALTEDGTGRAARLRIAAAATLAAKGERATALTLLQGEGAPLVAARGLVEGGMPLPGAIDDATSGIGELLVRVAIDLQRQDVPALALTYARLATFFAPDSSETWLVASELLNAQDRPRDALAALANITPGDPFAALAADNRIKSLVAAGDGDAALVQARVATERPDVGITEWTRLGDLYGELDRYGEAAGAYDRALQSLRAGAAGPPEWTLHLLKGGMLEEAGRWPEAKASLEAAYKLAPDQPIVLNYLGYSQLERRENIDAAMALIAEASRLEPDSSAITDSLGWAHYLRGNVPEAIRLLERAAEGEPADPAINEHLGDAYYKAGRRVDARYAWAAALIYADVASAGRLKAKIDSGWADSLASP